MWHLRAPQPIPIVPTRSGLEAQHVPVERNFPLLVGHPLPIRIAAWTIPAISTRPLISATPSGASIPPRVHPGQQAPDRRQNDRAFAEAGQDPPDVLQERRVGTDDQHRPLCQRCPVV